VPPRTCCANAVARSCSSPLSDLPSLRRLLRPVTTGHRQFLRKPADEIPALLPCARQEPARRGTLSRPSRGPAIDAKLLKRLCLSARRAPAPGGAAGTPRVARELLLTGREHRGHAPAHVRGRRVITTT
jgi:hypothetical protein